MKRLTMLMSLGFVVPMFGARSVLKYGDVNPMTGEVVEPYQQKDTVEDLPAKPPRVNKGRLVKIAEEEGLFTPEERALFMQEDEQEMLPGKRPAYEGFVGQDGQPLPPALPPKPKTKPSKQFTAQDLKNVKLKPLDSSASVKEQLMMQEEQEASKGMVKRPFSKADLKQQKKRLKKVPSKKDASQQESSLQEEQVASEGMPKGRSLRDDLREQRKRLKKVSLEKDASQQESSLQEEQAASEEVNMVPSAPALPPRSKTKPSKQFTAQDLQNVKLRPTNSAVSAQEQVIVQEEQAASEGMPKGRSLRDDLREQKKRLKKVSPEKDVIQQKSSLQESLHDQIKKRRVSIEEPSENLAEQQDWD